MEFNNTESIEFQLDVIFEKVLDDMTKQIFDVLQENLINKAYINNSQTGELSDLFKRDYVNYANGTGTPTLEFYNAFDWLRSTVEKHTRDLFYFEELLTTETDYIHADEDLYDILESGNNRGGKYKTAHNSGGFMEDTLMWISDNFENMFVSTCSKYRLVVTRN